MGTQFIWPSVGRTAVGENIGRYPLARRLGGSAQLEKLGFLRQAQLFLISVRRRHQKMAGRKTQIGPNVVETQRKMSTLRIPRR